MPIVKLIRVWRPLVSDFEMVDLPESTTIGELKERFKEYARKDAIEVVINQKLRGCTVWEDDPCKDDGLPLADAGEEFPENTIIHVNCRDYKVIEEAKAAKAAGDSCVLFDNRVDTYDPINKIAVERDGPHPLAHTLKPGDIGNRAPHVPPPTTTGGDAVASAAGGGRPWDGIAEGERDVALLFPGQGAQAVGMGAALADSGVPGVAELFSTASTILGYDLLKLCKEGPMEKLSMTMYSQPAIFTVSMASILKLQHEKPETLKRARLVRRAIRRRAIRRRNSAAQSWRAIRAITRARARFSSDAPRRRRRRPPASRSASTRRSCTPARCRSRTG